MRTDLVERLERVYGAIAALESLARLMDSRVGGPELPPADVSNVITVLAETMSDRLDVVNVEFRDKVAPFYRDFLKAREAMSGART